MSDIEKDSSFAIENSSFIKENNTITEENKFLVAFGNQINKSRTKEVQFSGNDFPTTYRTVSHNISERISTEIHEPFDNDKLAELTWHKDHIDIVLQDFETDAVFGLSTGIATQRIKQYGYNKQSKVRVNWLVKILNYFFNGFGAVFLIAGVLFILCWKPLGDPPAIANLALGITLLVIFFIQAAINWYQDFSSGKVLQSVKQLLEPEISCIRDGQITQINTELLVPGDIVLISSNTRIPADMRILQTNGLVFDKSILNGESRPVIATTEANDTNILESTSVAIQGTLCTSGSGIGVVTATGDDTIFGNIAKLSSKPKKGLSTLQVELFRFMAIIFSIAIALIVIILIVWGAYIKHKYPNWLNTVNLVATIISCFFTVVPEGIPISFATVLTITAKKMQNSNIVCKSLLVVETLGSVSVLCTDKTGTITTGVMSVTNTVGDIEKLQKYCGLCNECQVENGQISGGNATDKALMRFSMEGSSSANHFEGKLVKDIPFDSKTKFLAKIYETSKELLAVIKGAPDYLLEGLKQPNNLSKNELIKIQYEWAANGMRVVLVCTRKFELNYDLLDIETTIIFDLEAVGLIALADPLRDHIPEVILNIQEAGIKTVMITGDFELTAVSIAKMAGIITQSHDTINNMGSKEAIVINGPEMYRLSEVDWDKLVQYKEIVFSRTSPEQKLRIVKEFQKRKYIVAMTGDGVNDAPSLKQADVGISVHDGTEIAKEASDLVLMDSFLSIVDAIKYGRLVFENLRKTICYLLPAGTYSEVWALLLFAIWGFPQMLSSFLMIVICCVTDCIASMIISYETEETNLLKKPPRSVTGERLVDWKLLLHAYFTFGTYYCFSSMFLAFLHCQRLGISFDDLHKYFIPTEYQPVLNVSLSIYFVHLVILQAFNLVTVRSRYISCFRNLNWRLLVVVPIIGSTFIWNYIPAIQRALGTGEIPVEYYFISLGFGVLLVVYDELRKMVIRRNPQGFVARIAW